MSLNLADCIALSTERSPDKTAVKFGKMQMSYAELSAAVCRVANILHSKGIGQGDNVAILLPNTPHFLIIYYGILHAGATVVSLNILLKKRELIYQLEDSNTKALFVWQDFTKEAVVAAKETASCKHIIEVEAGMTPESPESGDSFMSLMMEASVECDIAQTNPDDTAVILYTSALDGHPKGAMLSHFNIFSNALLIKDHVLYFGEDDSCLAALPLFHSFGQTTMMTIPLLAGGTVILMPRFDGQKALEILQKESIAIAAFVPTMFYLMVEAKKNTDYDLSHTRAIVSGGQKLPYDLHARFKDRFNKHIMEGYGLTETSPVVSFNLSEDESKIGSIGKPIWATRAQIWDNNGNELPFGEIGEIVLRGPNIMKGYLNSPEASQKIMEGGWLHTGDYAYKDSDGYLFITGLKKNMILRAGMNIYPVEIEMILREHPDVEDAVVIGVSDPMRGEEVVAFVKGNNLTEDDDKILSAHCRENLASYKIPRKFVYLEKLSKYGDNKSDKDELLALLAVEN